AAANLESITYELSSHPNPGIFSKFFGERGYQRGKAIAEPSASGADTSTKAPQGWTSEADWRGRITGLSQTEKQSKKSAKLVMAEQAINRLRRWTSGNHTADKTTPTRQDLADDAGSVEESETLLEKTEDVSTTGSSFAKSSSSAGDLLKRTAPTTLGVGIWPSRKVRSTTSVILNTVGSPRAAGDFCIKAAAMRFNGGLGLKAAGKVPEDVPPEEPWTAKKVPQVECSQRSIDGIFKRFLRKK
ncbi:unnamed protein product, partial [Ixodes hexagonus]